MTSSVLPNPNSSRPRVEGNSQNRLGWRRTSALLGAGRVRPPIIRIRRWRRPSFVPQPIEQLLDVAGRNVAVIFERGRQNLIGDLEPKRTIALELGLTEPLVERGFVWKFSMCVGVAPDRTALGAVISGLERKDEAVLGGG